LIREREADFFNWLNLPPIGNRALRWVFPHT